MNIHFLTYQGSKIYNLETKDSDTDILCVFEEEKTKRRQSIENNIDTKYTEIQSLIGSIASGNFNTLEPLWTPEKFYLQEASPRIKKIQKFLPTLIHPSLLKTKEFAQKLKNEINETPFDKDLFEEYLQIIKDHSIENNSYRKINPEKLEDFIEKIKTFSKDQEKFIKIIAISKDQKGIELFGKKFHINESCAFYKKAFKENQEINEKKHLKKQINFIKVCLQIKNFHEYGKFLFPLEQRNELYAIRNKETSTERLIQYALEIENSYKIEKNEEIFNEIEKLKEKNLAFL